MIKRIIVFVMIYCAPSGTFGQSTESAELSVQLPEGYKAIDKIYGDLNNDGADDCVIIIKKSDKTKLVRDRNNNPVDRNRRGIIALVNEKGLFREIFKNEDCFSSENEDGGVYFAPDMSVEISNGKLFINYGHGRYGYWRYTFRLKNSDFELIGYDQGDHHGPVKEREISINFLTKSKSIKENINKDPKLQSGDEIFKEKWMKIKSNSLIKLSEIRDFDRLEVEKTQ